MGIWSLPVDLLSDMLHAMIRPEHATSHKEEDFDEKCKRKLQQQGANN